MKTTTKNPRPSEFPRIDVLELHRLRDVAQIPAKSAKSPRAVGAWRLAKRMKEAEANARMKARFKDAGHEVKDCDLSESRDWKNVFDYITSAISKGDFSVMDEFAKAWLTWEIKPDIVAANDDFSLTVHSGETVTNKKERPVTLSVIEAIMALQRGGRHYVVRYGDTMEKISSIVGTDPQRLAEVNTLSANSTLNPGRTILIPAPDRAPSFQEIQAEVGRMIANGISDHELSKQLKKLGLQDRVPHQDEVGASRKRIESRSGIPDKRARKAPPKKTS